jgi:DASS family divalent anion:Na+ symporter
LTRPTIRETPEAAQLARSNLAQMGAISRAESVVLGIFVLAFVLWITGSLTHLSATAVALLGLCLMLAFGAITWRDVLEEHAAWDALIWFGGLVGMATMLGKLGFMTWFSGHIAQYVAGWSWPWALIVLVIVYIYSHYLFASLAAHATAFFVPFLTIAVAAGAPAYMAALAFAFSSSLCVSLTHYGGGPSPVYWGSGYVGVKQWWSVGFVASLLHLLIWIGIGTFWWRVLGLF